MLFSLVHSYAACLEKPLGTGAHPLTERAQPCELAFFLNRRLSSGAPLESRTLRINSLYSTASVRKLTLRERCTRCRCDNATACPDSPAPRNAADAIAGKGRSASVPATPDCVTLRTLATTQRPPRARAVSSAQSDPCWRSYKPSAAPPEVLPHLIQEY